MGFLRAKDERHALLVFFYGQILLDEKKIKFNKIMVFSPIVCYNGKNELKKLLEAQPFRTIFFVRRCLFVESCSIRGGIVI